MKCCFLAAALLMSAALPAAAADIFSDDFEQGAGRWGIPAQQWSVAEGEGLDGSRALALEYGKDDIPKWLEKTEMVRVEPGEAYRIEAWVNDSEFHAHERPVSVSFAVYDKKGRLLRGAGAGSKRVIDNIIRKDGYYRVEGTSRPLPPGAYKARFYIWAKEGSYGRVLFDGFRAYPVSVNPLVDLCCSAYRNEAAGGKVRFSAGYAINELKYDLKKIHAELKYVSPCGAKTAAATLQDGVASVELPVSEFAPGTNEVKMALKNGDAVIGESSCRFARLDRLPARKVRIDSRYRTIVDGKPFFPLGMYWNDINAADLAVYTNSPFNCLMPYKRPDRAKMDMCEKFGMKVLFPICGFYELLSGTNVQKAALFKEKYIDGMVRQFRSHPAVLAWYLSDEPSASYAKLLEERNRMCHELDPDHPTWVCLNAPGVVRTFVNGYDVVGMDPYPIGSPFGRTDIDLAADWARQAMRGMYASRAMWQIPQAFDWTTYAAKQKAWKKPAGMRMPTREEMRSMTWQAIAAGSNGIVYYYFEDAYRRGGTKEENERRWADVCAVAKEVKDRAEVLLSEPGPDVGQVPRSLLCRTWTTAAGEVYLLACNLTRSGLEAKVSVGGKEIPLALEPIGVKWMKCPRLTLQ